MVATPEMKTNSNYNGHSKQSKELDDSLPKLNVSVRRAYSAGESVIKVDGLQKKKWWWQKLKNRKVEKKVTSRTPQRVPVSPHLSDTGIYMFQGSNPLYEGNTPNKQSLLSSLKYWGKPSKVRSQGPLTTGGGVKNTYQNPYSTGAACPTQFLYTDQHRPPLWNAGRPMSAQGHQYDVPQAPRTPRTPRSPMTPRSPRAAVAPRAKDSSQRSGAHKPHSAIYCHPLHGIHGVHESLGHARSTPLAFDDVFLPPDVKESASPLNPASPSGLSRTKSGASSKGAGCKEVRRRAKHEEGPGSAASGIGNCNRGSCGSSGMGSASSGIGSSNPSEASTFFTDDFATEGSAGDGKENSQLSSHARTADSSFTPRYSGPIRTVRQVSSGNEGQISLIDTVRSSCFEDLEHGDMKKPKKLRPKKLLSKLLVRRPSVELITEARGSGGRCTPNPSGRRTPEGKSPKPKPATPKCSAPRSPHKQILGVLGPSNAGSASTSAYSRRQEVLGKIMEKRLNDLSSQVNATCSMPPDHRAHQGISPVPVQIPQYREEHAPQSNKRSGDQGRKKSARSAQKSPRSKKLASVLAKS